MESSMYLLVPISVLLVFAIGAVFWWSLRYGQFDDLEGPAYRVLMDDDTPDTTKVESDRDGDAGAVVRKS